MPGGGMDALLGTRIAVAGFCSGAISIARSCLGASRIASAIAVLAVRGRREHWIVDASNRQKVLNLCFAVDFLEIELTLYVSIVL